MDEFEEILDNSSIPYTKEELTVLVDFFRTSMKENNLQKLVNYLLCFEQYAEAVSMPLIPGTLLNTTVPNSETLNASTSKPKPNPKTNSKTKRKPRKKGKQRKKRN